MILFAMLLIVGAIDPGALTPTPAVAAASAPGVAKVSNDDQVACRRQAEPNSNILKKVCMTNAQWKQRQRDDQETLQDMQRQALRSTVGSGAP